jgi:hypothetical protein
MNMFGDFKNTSHSPKISFDTENLNLTTTADILEFLKESGIKQFKLAELQSENADKQFRNNIKLNIFSFSFCFHIYCANFNRIYSHI